MSLQCVKCGGPRTVRGALLDSEGSAYAKFQPERAKTGSKFLGRGVALPAKDCWACLDCGLVWTQADVATLGQFVERHCTLE